MTHTTLAMPEALWSELTSWLDDPNELAGVLTARVIDDAQGTTLLARQLFPAHGSAYQEQRRDALALRSTGWVPAVRAAARDGAMAIFVHTHPGGVPTFSQWDDQVDDMLSPEFQELTGLGIYGAVVLAADATVAARLRRGSDNAQRVDQIRITGDRLQIRQLERPPDDLGAMHDRQIRAFGARGQAILQSLRIGVVGAGGTGSPIIEQLARLGVGSVTVIDDDVVTASSVARGYGSSAADIGRPKVDVAVDNVERIGTGTQVVPVRQNLRALTAANTLRHCDLVFCCVDGHAGRVVLNRWAYWHIAPVIDVGVLVSSLDEEIQSIDGRITWLAPSTACLLCRGRIDPRLAHVENLDPEERRRLAQQGYAPELEEPEPSIVTYTSLLASLATTELLNRLFGFADSQPTELLLQLHSRSISLNRRPSRPGCVCNDPSNWGRGTNEPYLDLTWAS